MLKKMSLILVGTLMLMNQLSACDLKLEKEKKKVSSLRTMCFEVLSTFFKRYPGNQDHAKQDAEMIEACIGEDGTKALLRYIVPQPQPSATFPVEGLPLFSFSFDKKKFYFRHSKNTIASLHLPSKKLSTLNIPYAIMFALCRVNDEEKLYVQSHNGSVTLVNARNFTKLKLLQNELQIKETNHRLFFSPDVNYLYAYANGNIAAWDTNTDKKIWHTKLPYIYTPLVQAKNKIYFIGNIFIPSTNLCVFSPDNRSLKELNVHSQELCCVGEELYSANDNGITIFNSKDDTKIIEIPYNKKTEPSFYKSMFFHNDKLFIKTPPDFIQIFDTKQKQFLPPLEHPTIAEIRIKNDYLFSKDHATCIKVWDLQTYKCIRTFKWKNGDCNDFRIEMPYIFAGFSDGTITIWNFETQEIVSTFNAKQTPIFRLILLNDNLISWADTDLKIWNAAYLRCKTDQERLACLMLENNPSAGKKNTHEAI